MMVYVECYADELLVRVLGVPRSKIRHERCKGNIANRLRKLPFGMGLVDQDPESADSPREFRQYRLLEELGGVILKADPSQPLRRIIILCPRLEEWLYRRAAVNELDLLSFGLPDNAAELKKVPHFWEKKKFHEFLKVLRSVDQEMKKVAKWLIQTDDADLP